jgi:putative aldouronate transport system substrate-binding protein
VRKRRTLILLVCVILVLTTVLGCSNDSKQAEEPPAAENKGEGAEKPADDKEPAKEEAKPKEPLKLKIAITTGGSKYIEGSPNINEDKYVKHFEQLSGTDLTLELIPHETYDQSMSLLLAGGELPDILQTKGINRPEIAPAVDAGVLMPLNELIDQYGPNLKKHVPAESWKSARVSKDGKIYGIPGENPIRNGTVVYIRKDWLEKLNLQVPKTIEEYIEVLRAFKTGDPNGNGKPDEIPFGGRAKFSHTNHFFGAFDVIPSGWRMVDGSLTPNFIRPEMKEALKVYKQLYTEKLLDNEVFVNSGKMWDDKIVGQGVVGMWAHAAVWGDAWEQRLKKNFPEAEIAHIAAPVGPSGKPGGIYGIGSSISDFVWAIPQGAKNPEEIIKFFDWFYSEEVPNDFFLYGIEGDTYTKDGDKIQYKYPDTNDAYGIESLHQEWLHFTGPKKHLTDENFIKGKQGGELIFEGIAVSMKEGIVDDGLDMPAMETSKARPELDYSGLWLEFAAKVVTGKESVDKFDEFVADWKARGGDQLIKEATEWYNSTH